MEEEGIIVDVKGEMAKVAINPQFSCAHCSLRNVCLQSGEKVYTEALNPLEAQVGDLVRVEMPAGSVYGSTFLLFFMPLVALSLGFGLAQWAGFSQGLSITFGLLSAGGWFLLLWRIERRRSRHRPLPMIIGLVKRKTIERRSDEPSQGRGQEVHQR